MPRPAPGRPASGSALARLAVPGAVVLALLIVFAIAWVTRPGPGQAPVTGSQAAAGTAVTRSCPPSAPGAAAAKIAAISLPGASAPAGAAGQGSVKANAGSAR